MFNKNTVKGTKTWFNQIREQEKKKKKKTNSAIHDQITDKERSTG